MAQTDRLPGKEFLPVDGQLKVMSTDQKFQKTETYRDASVLKDRQQIVSRIHQRTEQEIIKVFISFFFCITPLLSLALDPAIGRYGGIIIGATLGCTITFTIPVGMGMLGSREKPLFARGILAGLSALPAGILVGGLFCGIPVVPLIVQSIPVPLLAVLLILGLSHFPEKMIRGFSIFATVIRAAGTIGITLGAFSYMTGVSLLPRMTSLDEALKTVSSIGIVLLGSLPFAEILQRVLKQPWYLPILVLSSVWTHRQQEPFWQQSLQAESHPSFWRSSLSDGWKHENTLISVGGLGISPRQALTVFGIKES